jgi:hypothetical protein
MKELYELKERLIDELKDYGKRDLSGSSLDMIDKLAHATKNLCKIIDDSDEGQSGYYDDTRAYRRYSRNHPYSYRRDSMGRYSRDGLADKLRELMDEAPDDSTRMELKRLVDKM